MPWCEDCAKYFAPSALTPEGHCPRCDADLEAPEPVRPQGDGEGGEDEKVPWHFKLMVVALIAYLVWRFYEILFA